MRIIFGGILMAVLALQVSGAVRTIIPNGGAGAAYFSNNNTLYAFDAKTLALTSTVPGIGLVNLSVSPDGKYLYGATPQCNGCAYRLEIVSTSSLEVVATIPSAYQPGPALFLGN